MLGLAEATFGLVEAMLGLVEATFGLVEAMLGLVEAMLGLAEAMLGLVEAMLGLVEAMLGFVEAMLGLAEAMLGLAEAMLGLLGSAATYQYWRFPFVPWPKFVTPAGDRVESACTRTVHRAIRWITASLAGRGRLISARQLSKTRRATYADPGSCTTGCGSLATVHRLSE